MMITQSEKQLIKSYRLWAVMQAEDSCKLQNETAAQDMGAHNQHVIALRQRAYYTCLRAVQEYEQKLKLYPQ